MQKKKKKTEETGTCLPYNLTLNLKPLKKFEADATF